MPILKTKWQSGTAGRKVFLVIKRALHGNVRSAARSSSEVARPALSRHAVWQRHLLVSPSKNYGGNKSPVPLLCVHSSMRLAYYTVSSSPAPRGLANHLSILTQSFIFYLIAVRNSGVFTWQFLRLHHWLSHLWKPYFNALLAGHKFSIAFYPHSSTLPPWRSTGKESECAATQLLVALVIWSTGHIISLQRCYHFCAQTLLLCCHLPLVFCFSFCLFHVQPFNFLPSKLPNKVCRE